MKTVIAAALLCAAPLWGVAHAASTDKAPQNTAAKAKTPVAKEAPAGKPVASAKAGKAVKVAALTAVGAAGAGAAIAATKPAETKPQDPALLALAEQVHVGRIPCELGAHVIVSPDASTPGHFHVEGKGFKYHMSPVTTTTGTVRLEDQKAGAVWLQIANKSMLMNQKLGQRMADECMSPAQLQVAEAIKKNPPRSVLD